MQRIWQRHLGSALLSTLLFPFQGSCQGNQASPLQISYGSSGLERLSYQGVTLADLGAHPGDNFYIGHMKATDSAGNVVSAGQYGWGENNSGKHWDSASHTWQYAFNWGSISVQYLQDGTNLNLITTVANKPDSGIVFSGAAVFPVVLRFPQLPAGFSNASYPQMAYNTTGPSVTTADWGSGEVVAVAPDAGRPLYSGFWPASGGGGVAYSTEISGTTPDGLAVFQPHNDRPVQPGQTDQYTVSLRFGPSGTSTKALAADAYSSWAAHYPAHLNWTDRRAIGTAFLASSPQGSDASQPGGFPTNPRRYFNSAGVDVQSPGGLGAFQAQILSKAQEIVANSRQMNAQGVITWDIEGEQYPQATSYVCEPDAIAQIAPEMESTVSVPGSPYAGQKLDDAYFATIRAASLRAGVCIRPQHFTLNPNGTATQTYLAGNAIGAELTRKARYAHDRWGVTLFYVDSTVDSNGGVLPASVFQQLQATLPDSLFIPEESNVLDYAYSAPFKSFIYLNAVGTDPTVLFSYPHAFSAVLVNDVDPARLAAAQGQLTAQVRQGDILMGHVDYWQANNPVIVAIYQAAGVTQPLPAPVATAPDPGPAPVVVAQPDPSPAPVPNPTPDPTPVATTTPDPAPVPLTPALPDPTPVTPVAVPVPVIPTAPMTPALIEIASLAQGQTVSGNIVVQGMVNATLDAAGSHLIVDGFDLLTTRLTNGPYLYSLDTRTLGNGPHVLQLWGHDIGNNTLLSDTVAVVVSN